MAQSIKPGTGLILSHSHYHHNMLIPENDRIEIMGASSDHLIVDFTRDSSVKVGDVISFIPGYSSLLRAMTSPYVEKVYL